MTEEHPSSTHPPLPPKTEDDRFSWLRLLRSRRVGIATFYRLLSEHGSAQAALAVLPEVARAAGVNDYAICPEGVIHAELRAGRAAGAHLIFRGDTHYSPDLAEISDAPPILWALGDLTLLTRPAVAMVGARNASSLGTRMARKLAADLSTAGYVVVSGLARGIDAAAHKAALEGGTIAVQAGGVDVIYPTENADLAHDIARSGLRITEQMMGLEPQARHFPARNRIIAGLSRAVVVVEAAAKSGSLITAECALSQGRDVYAVPGHPFDARAAGCNHLIRDGATLVRSAEDVIATLSSAPQARAPVAHRPVTPPPDHGRERPADRPDLRDIAALHRRILDRLGPSPVAEDQLIRDLGTTAHTVAPALVDLELEGRIARQAGGLLARIN